jgi:hypothetical protein
MTLADMAEVAVVIGAPQEENARAVTCAECGLETDAVTCAERGFTCPDCEARICVMCGCTDNVPCLLGCAWVSPGRCTSHNPELRELAARVFGG